MLIEIETDNKRLSEHQKRLLIKNEAWNYYQEEDLFSLANIYLKSYLILKKNNFPLKAYRSWLKKNGKLL